MNRWAVISAWAVGAAVTWTPPAAHGEQIRPAVPVQVGGRQEASEGCAGTSTVTVRTGSTLNLRAGPGLEHPVIGRLVSGQSVSVCQRVGSWVGILVHPNKPQPQDCEVSDLGPKPMAYTGPCGSGWVSDKYLRVLAG